MSNITNQPLANPLSVSDLLILWSASGGDTRRASLSALVTFLAQQLAGYLGAIRLFMPFVSGTANALSVGAPASVTIATLDLGDSFSAIPLLANTAAVTITMNVNGVPVTKALFKDGIPVIANAILAGVPFDFMYDGTQFTLLR